MMMLPSRASDVKTDFKDELDIKDKFEPWLWDKIQALQSNGIMENLSLIIRLVRDQQITGMQIGDLKNYAASLFTESHNATIYSICNVLPVVMAKAPVAEAERIAAYEFVESIGDGDRKGYVGLDISRPAIRADDVEATLGYNGSEKIIAILDTGINSSHPDLNDLDDDPSTFDPKVIDEMSFVDLDDDGVPDPGPRGEPMDYLGHGTHVAGIAAGTGEASNHQYNGTALGAWLMNIKVAYLIWTAGGPTGTFEDDDVINGIDYAISQGADVISMSLGIFPGGDGTSELAKAADDAVDEGVVVVILAGNNGPSGQSIWTPADAFNVITVGAVDDGNTVDIDNDILADFSSRGPTGDGRPKPDVVAPGVNIIAPMDHGAAYWQTYPDIRVGNFYAELDGTSMATPHVSGTVALMLEANPNLTPAQVKAILRQTARLNDNLSGLDVNDRGHGIIDAYAAVQLASNVDDVNKYLMYDSFDVSTPNRDLGWWCYDYLTFTVSGPSSTYGINLRYIDYHYRHPLGVGNTDYRLLFCIGARHVWIDDTYYDLGKDMHKYLFSGPRIRGRGGGYVEVVAIYRVDGVFVWYVWTMDVDELDFGLGYYGDSSYKTLIYIDPDVWDTTNYPYLELTLEYPSETIYYERKLTGDDLERMCVRDLDHTEHIKIQPFWGDNAVMWVLRYGYFGNNPDTALNEQYTYDRDIIIYYQGTSDMPGPFISRKTESLPQPEPPPARPSKPSGPTSGYTGTTYTYKTSTTDPQGYSINYQFDWGDESRTWTGWHASGENASATHEWSSPGTYYVRVRAANYVPAWSDWSPPLTVNIVNRPPNTPSKPSGPTSGYRNVWYTYTTSTTDPDGDDVRYQFEFTGPDTDVSFTTGWYASGETGSITVRWEPSDPLGAYQIRVRAQDVYGLWSSWSPYLTVSIRNPDLTVLAEDQNGTSLYNIGYVYIDDEYVGNLGSTFTVTWGEHEVFLNDFWEPNNTGYRYGFQHWEDDSTENPRTITVVEDTTIKAYFYKKWCPGDVNGDGVVNIIDIELCCVNMGPVPPSPPECDVNGDGTVNVIDVIICSTNMGSYP